jgi:hypothetical protein
VEAARDTAMTAVQQRSENVRENAKGQTLVDYAAVINLHH